MIDNEKVEMKKYIEFLELSKKDKTVVSLVMNSEINQIAVKKVIKGRSSTIYNKIKNIDNTYIPKIYFINEEEDCIIVIEEYIEGITLQDMLLASEPIAEEMLLDIILQLCKPLNLLHNLPEPIIHRDIKPSNIIISKSGILKLIDFDASREYKQDATKDTISLGTVSYAAPEQFGYSQTDVRTDIYAIGMLITDFLEKVVKENYTYRHISELKRIVNKCTMFDPNQRYQDINDLQRAISKIKNRGRVGHKILGATALFGLIVMLIIVARSLNNNPPFMNLDALSAQTDFNSSIITTENDSKLDVSIEAYNDMSSKDDKPFMENDLKNLNAEKINESNIISESNIINESNISSESNIINESNIISESNISNEFGDTPNSHGEVTNNESFDILEITTDTETIIDETHIHEDTYTDLDNDYKAPVINDKKDIVEDYDNSDKEADVDGLSIEAHTMEPTIANPNTDYYKHPKYSEDIKIYINYNKASKVEYLNLLKYGHINPSNYTIDGNIITIKKEYLHTLADDYYNLYIAFDKGQPINAQFEVHAENEEFTYGKYQLSHYYREFYTSSPESLTYIVYNTDNTRIKALWNGSSKIESSYYNIEENGYVVSLYKGYLNAFTEGSTIMLRLEFDNGDMQETYIKIMREPIISPSFLSAENTFIKSSPDDVAFKIIWNDANDLLAIQSTTLETPELSNDYYQLEGDIFTINKEFLLKQKVGTYKWMFVFDMNLNNSLTIHICD